MSIKYFLYVFYFILFYFIFSAVSELTFLGDDKRIGIGERKLAVCNEFLV